MNLVIVDDSRLARKELANLLPAHPQLELIGEAADIESAVTVIDSLKPDLLLLDIHLPDGSGFDLLERCEHIPKVIFTTAYEQHALQAFTVNALDYLLKPITQERFNAAVERLIEDTPPLSLQPKVIKRADDHIFIRDGENCHFVKFLELRHIRVEGNYVRTYFRSTHALLSRSLNYVEERLDPAIFFRANRQEIINLNFIGRIEPWVNDGLLIVMQDGTEVEVSRRQARQLKLALAL